MVYNGQATCFHAYRDKNKEPLRRFGSTILTAKRMNIDRVFELARIYNIESVHTSVPLWLPKSKQPPPLERKGRRKLRPLWHL